MTKIVFKRWALCVLFLLPGARSLVADELVIISPHWEGVKIEFTRAFQQHYQRNYGRKIEVSWLDIGGTSDILRYIRSEFSKKPGGIGVDLFFGGGIDPYEALKEQGLLARYPVPPEILKNLAPEINGVPLYDPDFTWYAAAMAGFGIMYNKHVLRRLHLPVPQTWADLADPVVFSWVGSADPRKSGSVHMAYEIILQAYGWKQGWEIITGMCANVRGFNAYGAQIPKDVAVGEVAYGMTIDSYAWAQVNTYGAENIGFVMPGDLTVVNGDAVAILKNPPHLHAAQAFVDFVLSEAGQKIWILDKGDPEGPQEFVLSKFSVLPHLYEKIKGRTAMQMNPFEWKSRFLYDQIKGSERWTVVNDLMGSLIIEPHNHLKKFQKNALAANQTAKFLEVPVSEDSLRRVLHSGKWQDTAYRNQQIKSWAERARTHYGASGQNLVQNAPLLLLVIFGIWMFIFLRKTNRR
jgi:ABC-type Fe3+ transport system substrate-binding protein